MGVALGWMALALTAVAGAPDAGRGGVPIKYTVRFVEADGVGWREAVFTRLTPVTRQGSATVWTAPHDVAKRLVEHATKHPIAQDLRAPTVIAWSGSPVHIRHGGQPEARHPGGVERRRPTGRSQARDRAHRLGRDHRRAASSTRASSSRWCSRTRQVIAVHRVALGRPAEPKTSPETQKAACQVDGVRGCSKCCEAGENARSTTTSKVTFKWEWNLGGVAAAPGQYIHDDVKFFPTGPDSCRAATRTATKRTRDAGRAATDPASKATGGVVAASVPAPDCCSTTATLLLVLQGRRGGERSRVEVPEIGSQEIAGEWLIPKDGILLVSFGPHTVADKDGKAVVRERLAIVEAEESAEPAAMPAPLPRSCPRPGSWSRRCPPSGYSADARRPRCRHPPVAGACRGRSRADASPGPAEMPMAPMPPVPSRSIPQGYHIDGRAADLPPLPPEENDDDDDASESAEPRPSPQTRKSRQPEPAPEMKPGRRTRRAIPR